MNTFEAIKNRRSIRSFTAKTIRNKDINIMLDCAMSAPTARNQQSWRFVVIDNREILNEISLNIEYAKMCSTANKAIIVCSVVESEMQNLYWEQDCSAATQNILLSATDLGIGSVWVAIHPRESKINYISKLLKLPLNIKPLSLVALGYASGQKELINRFDEDKIKYNKWSN